MYVAVVSKKVVCVAAGGRRNGCATPKNQHLRTANVGNFPNRWHAG
ncbi:hypothetical protein RMSM_05290 [Rhodopirellula maiorica SM1]|uniref:Uncharacterized protein n=1 Tax=Rhodopirellula maiorica SM1 TaxID=1265738 RepID=M5RUZ1_9BACT|nr:hypothetical protein RMSM_05290 [Rhodopirellula maiorica SM1]